MPGKSEASQLSYPKCRFQKMVYASFDGLPLCPECDLVQMIIEELLDKSKSYGM